MRSAGIDVASIGYAGMALAIDGEPAKIAHWKPDNGKDSDAERLLQFYRWVTFKLGLWKPDLVAVEELAVFMNKKVIRSLSKREGVALLAAKQRRCLVVNPPVSQARSIVLGPSPGQGSWSKDDAWIRIKKMHPAIAFSTKTNGGTDEADALVHALAGPVILERR